MPYKLKIDAVEAVATQIAKRTLDKTFKETQKVDGEKLISLTNSRQINSFLIRSLFHQWRREVEHLESPYFDFKHEKVKDALKQFMNVLSNHISIDEEHLRPLLERAVRDAFLISFEPGEYLKGTLERADKPIDVKRELKYIKTNRTVFKQLLEQIDEFSTKDLVLGVFDQYSKEGFEEVDAKELLIKLEAEHLIDELFDFEKPPVEPDVAAPLQTTASSNEEQKTEKVPKVDVTLNDQFQGNKQAMTLAEKLQQKMKKSIESGLTLNEKFMFQNALFGGDAAKMREALRALDTASSLNEALEKANAFNQGWDMESEEVEALMFMLQKRFS